MLHVFCMSLIKIIRRNFVLADLFDFSPNNKNNKVCCKLTFLVSKNMLAWVRGVAHKGDTYHMRAVLKGVGEAVGEDKGAGVGEG